MRNNRYSAVPPYCNPLGSSGAVEPAPAAVIAPMLKPGGGADDDVMWIELVAVPPPDRPPWNESGFCRFAERIMKANLESRLSRLESATPAGRTVFIWDDDDCDLDELKRPNDKGIFIRWLRPGEMAATE